ncbi:MAG TPA: heme ABC exporter ATP-binding protein CcmA [Acidobacteriaceae bacterium]|nr:heme ABC exporter ATP-binding protein CcmA [Acidobacteriaceae bacterium]
MPSTACAIHLEEVSKVYGDFAALRKVTVEIRSGQTFVVLGQNGAGKSTLLRILAGLIRPSFGKVGVLGSQDVAAIRRRIGYLSHDSMLYDELTALENLDYAARLYARDDPSAAPVREPEEALDLVGLDAKLDRPVGKFSQGMRQRAALARVLMSRPELLLLDEPFSNVDGASSSKMLQVLDLLRAEGKTILLTTHQPELARPIADCFCTMHEGQIASVEFFSRGGNTA